MWRKAVGNTPSQFSGILVKHDVINVPSAKGIKGIKGRKLFFSYPQLSLVPQARLDIPPPNPIVAPPQRELVLQVNMPVSTKSSL
jgi:hypothetical protein